MGGTLYKDSSSNRDEEFYQFYTEFKIEFEKAIDLIEKILQKETNPNYDH